MLGKFELGTQLDVRNGLMRDDTIIKPCVETVETWNCEADEPGWRAE